jgi:hypothetical protein
MKKYSLRRSEMIDALAYLELAIIDYQCEKDRKYLRSIFHKGWGIPDKAADALLSGKAPYTVTASAVEFEVETGK